MMLTLSGPSLFQKWQRLSKGGDQLRHSAYDLCLDAAAIGEYRANSGDGVALAARTCDRSKASQIWSFTVNNAAAV